MRLLVVEDDLELQELVAAQLMKEGYGVDAVADGTLALDYIDAGVYDCVVLDIMLTGTDGLTILRKMRSRNVPTPVILLTAKDTVNDRITGLDAGADDYLIKPFSPGELSARIRALLRRGREEVHGVELSALDLTMDTVSRQVLRGGKSIDLTPKEYALLEYMLRNKGRVLTRARIIEHLWNFDFDSDSNIIDVYIRFLRRKVDKDSDKKLIHTVRGTGYMLKEDG